VCAVVFAPPVIIAAATGDLADCPESGSLDTTLQIAPASWVSLRLRALSDSHHRQSEAVCWVRTRLLHRAVLAALLRDGREFSPIPPTPITAAWHPRVDF
jgi:hypothetical protein